MLKSHLSLLLATGIMLIVSSCTNRKKNSFSDMNHQAKEIPVPAIQFKPQSYVCYKTESLIIDGLIEEDSWLNAKWTADFVDIEGDLKPAPQYSTRAKMLWNNEYLYIAAEITEPHIQAKLRQRDTVIFYDNDFEVFIDPDGDSHGYYELELNALNTVWDLLLTKPYRDTDSHVLDAWDIQGLKSAVRIFGSLNDPSDLDDRWTLEIAMPMGVLSEWGSIPEEGEQWRINFSRVNWRTQVKDGAYVKELDPESGKTIPEYNWVWSPQGLINMHYPEMWGYLQFTEAIAGKNEVSFITDPDEEIKWELRKLYYAQKEYAANQGVYSSLNRELNRYSTETINKNIYILVKPSGYEAYLKSDFSGLTWVIDNYGRIYQLDQ